jgi:hypothetical protein
MGFAGKHAQQGRVNELLVGGRGDELPSTVELGSSALSGCSLEEAMCDGVCSGCAE